MNYCSIKGTYSVEICVTSILPEDRKVNRYLFKIFIVLYIFISSSKGNMTMKFGQLLDI